MDISLKHNINLNGARVTVLGLGRSGLGAARLAKYLGAHVFVSDGGTNPDFKKVLSHLNNEGISGEFGGHSEKVVQSDLVIISPGIPCDAGIVKTISEKSIPIVGEIEFSSWYADAPVIAVTGSNGKTTTVFAIHHMLDGTEFIPVLAGNMGISFSDVVLSDMQKPKVNRVYVLEISSFQMEFIHHFKPEIAVFLNITPDHLDRHVTMAAYSEAKFRMARNLTETGSILYNAEDSQVANKFSARTNAVPFGLKTIPGQLFKMSGEEIQSDKGEFLINAGNAGIPGKHNLSNLFAAATAAKTMGVSSDKIVRSIQTFRGVAHRMEYAGSINGADFINDSKATNVDAVKVALKSYSRPLILLLGGKDKAGNFKELIPLTHNVQYILAFGKARNVIAAALVDAVRLMQFIGLKDAVAESKRLARPGDIVLLSPGCASFDEFSNFEERGNFFKELVKQGAIQ